MKRLVFTGGHHNSALSVAQALVKQGNAEVIWYGHKYTILGSQNESAEYQEVTKSQIKFRDVKAGKVYKVYNPVHLFRVPFGFLQAFVLLLIDRPDLVVSFGGFIAAPVALAAWLQGIPVFSHEQTTVIGLANRFIARLADKLFITWPQSKQYLPAKKTVLTGLPLRQSIFEYKPEISLFKNDLPTIYLTGGKQGSHILNQTVEKSLEQILTKYNLIHQTGSNSAYKDFKKLSDRRNNLSDELKSRYILKEYVYEEEVGQIFHQADLVVSRAGAHIVYELAALGLPAILIPIPWASHNEQYKNARILVNLGSARILPEENLSPNSLLNEIGTLFDNINHYRQQAQSGQDQIIQNAKERIVDEIAQFFEKSEESVV